MCVFLSPTKGFLHCYSCGMSLLSVRKPSESKSIFFMIDFSLLCCSSGVSLTYSSTSSFGGQAIHRGQALLSVGQNDVEKRGYQKPPLPRCFGMTRTCSPRPRPYTHPQLSCLVPGGQRGPHPGPPHFLRFVGPRERAKSRPAPTVRPPQRRLPPLFVPGQSARRPRG